MDKNCSDLSCRRNRVGGQAIIEGVMMKHDENVAIAVRKEDGSIEIINQKFTSIKKKCGFFRLPLIRGIVGFIESLILSFKTMNAGTDALGLDEDEKDKDKDKDKKKSGSTTFFIMLVSVIIGLALAILLFSALPTYAARGIEMLFGELNRYVKALIEGVIKVGVFILYIVSISFMKDIKRTFQYHGAEHKSIACYEKGLELTPENARGCTRFHPRCGTSFMFVMIFLGIIVGMFIPFWDRLYLRIILKILLIPVIVGIGYEFIMYAGKHDNLFTKICSAPGLWMQRLTTKEPDEHELAVAICALKASMPDEFPDFSPEEYFITREENKDHIMYEDEKKEKEKGKREEEKGKSEE